MFPAKNRRWQDKTCANFWILGVGTEEITGGRTGGTAFIRREEGDPAREFGSGMKKSEDEDKGQVPLWGGKECRNRLGGAQVLR